MLGGDRVADENEADGQNARDDEDGNGQDEANVARAPWHRWVFSLGRAKPVKNGDGAGK